MCKQTVQTATNKMEWRRGAGVVQKWKMKTQESFMEKVTSRMYGCEWETCKGGGRFWVAE